MKLGVLLPHTKLYGGVKRFLELGNIFVRMGHSFYVFTPDGEGPEWFKFEGKMRTFDQTTGTELDALWTTTPKFIPLIEQSGAKHKIFYHVRIKERLKKWLKNPELELYACSTNVYEHDVKKYGRKAFKAIGGVTLANYQPKTDYSVKDRPFVVMGYGRLAERVKGTKYVVKACERLYKKGYNIKLLLFDTALNDEWQKKIDNFKCSCPYEFVQNYGKGKKSK